jgi:hypothetical protein
MSGYEGLGPYLIWNHEKGLWWGPRQHGYTASLTAAGRYTRDEAVKICADAIQGTAARLGVLPDLPVRETDLASMTDLYFLATMPRQQEPWM